MLIRQVTIDPGYTDFAQYIEQYNSDDILALEKRYKSLPKKLQRRTAGPMNKKIEDILEDLCLTGERVQTGVYNFCKEKNQGYNNETRKELIKHLTSFTKL